MKYRSGIRFTLGYAFICAHFFFFFYSLKGKKKYYSQHLGSAFNIGSKVPLAVEDRNVSGVSGDSAEHVSTET